MKKLKVCWICILNSKELDDLIGISSNEYVLPSIPIMLDQLRSRSDVEVHVIAGNRYRNETESISNNNVTFHLFKRFDLKNSDLINPLLDPQNIKLRNDQILDILNQIDPDIVHIHGACFLEFSPTVSEIIGRYPVFLSITGLIRHASQESAINKIVTWFETQILKTAKFFGIITDEIKSVITSLNKNAIFFDFQYQVFHPAVIKNNHGSESIDGIYFARLARDKGIFDFLTAIQLIVAQKPDSRFIIYGHGNAQKVKEVLDFAESLNISKVIDFRGYESDMQKVYKAALDVKICVLPTYHDLIPGTIIESMRMKLPVVSYAVGGVPELNVNAECVKLVTPRDTKALSNAMLELIQDKEKRRRLAENAYKYALEKFESPDFGDKTLKIYQKVISDFRSNYKNH